MLRRLLATAVLGLVAAAPACAPAAAKPVAPPAPAPPPPPGPEAHFHALLLNGGGTLESNFQPHLLHLRELRSMLLASGIPANHITVVSSDGDDPAPDVVSHGEQTAKNFWMLHGTRVERALDAPLVRTSSTIDGTPLLPATKDVLKKWFADEARVLAPGDTLLLYVTDHGNRGPDPMSNTIQLWGKEQLSVKELEELVRGLPSSVRVVSVMSQCFSGAFANMSIPAGDGDPRPNVCGYFSSTPDRPAYGCFAENVGKERVGHSFHFLRALAATRRMDLAHEHTLLVDDTPDVPLRSSDALLQELLRQGAKERGKSVEDFSAELLGPRWRDEPRWQEARALVDRIAGEYGLVSPPTLADSDEERDGMGTLSQELRTWSGLWDGAFTDAAGDDLGAFLAANPSWQSSVSDEALLKLTTTDERRVVSEKLVDALGSWTQKERGDLLDRIQAKRTASEEGAYRAEVRFAVTLRLQTILTTIAGQAFLERYGSQAQKDDYAAVRACENVTLPGPVPASANRDEDVTPFPSVASEWRLEKEVHPPWLGLYFAPEGVRPEVRKEHNLPDGVSLATDLAPDSPAAEAGLQPGDLILGTQDRPFKWKNEIRHWTMSLKPGEKGTLRVLRDGKEVALTIQPRPHPGPMAPRPPPTLAVGAAAPSSTMRAYRGGVANLHDGKPHLLLFWATWCHYCKESLPEVLAYAKAHRTEVVAITDEAPATLDSFFASWKTPFPKKVAIDDLNTAHIAYGVPGLPTFVLVDEKGVVRARGTGYGRNPGLPIPGWKWDGK